jgi:glycosyltransferase involved in cell wall biosynthesis
VPAVLQTPWMKQVPTVVSLDATPMQYDELGEFYAHDVGSDPAERVKKWANRRCFEQARHLVTWSEWAKQSVVGDYGISPEKISVIAPGVDVRNWARPDQMAARATEAARPLRILFVGGDLHRKGGDMLIQVARRLRCDGTIPAFELHLVTQTTFCDEPGVVVHRGLTANSPELMEVFHLADVFCLPTRGDCLPMVLAEAGAASLPLIATDVGAISELVREGESGFLIAPDDSEALEIALRTLLQDPTLRARMGRRAREIVKEHHDARANADKIAALLRQVASE